MTYPSRKSASAFWICGVQVQPFPRPSALLCRSFQRPNQLLTGQIDHQSPVMPTQHDLRIGYVPEHFSTPLHFAKTYFSLESTLIPFPSGTGHMVTALAADEIDIGIGLTEGWIAALGKAQAEHETPAPADFQLVGTYVETPLCWAVSTGHSRNLSSIADLEAKKVGVSRLGSGSHIMSFVLADKQVWLSPQSNQSQSTPFEAVPLQTFANLRQGVNDSTADFFMWEHFTSQRYYDNGSIKRIGEIYTPWPSWIIVTQKRHLNRDEGEEFVTDVLSKIDEGISYFKDHHDEAVAYISSELDYSKDDAKEWLDTVRFADGVRGVSKQVVDQTVEVLLKAAVLNGEIDTGAMIGMARA